MQIMPKMQRLGDVGFHAGELAVQHRAGVEARAGFATRVLLGLTVGVAPNSTAKAIEDLRSLNVSLTGTPAGAT